MMRAPRCCNTRQRRRLWHSVKFFLGCVWRVIMLFCAATRKATRLCCRARVRRRKFTPVQVDYVWNLTGGKCFWCFRGLGRSPLSHRYLWEGDHFVALAQGGPDELSNMGPTCTTCNGSKSDQCPFVFMRRLGLEYMPCRRVVETPRGWRFCMQPSTANTDRCSNHR